MAGKTTETNNTMAALEPYIEELASKPPTTPVERETWEEFRKGVVAYVSDNSSPAAVEFSCLRREYCPAAADFVRAMTFMENPLANLALAPRTPSDPLSSAPFRYAAATLVANHHRLTGTGAVPGPLLDSLSDLRIAMATTSARTHESRFHTIRHFLASPPVPHPQPQEEEEEKEPQGVPFATCPICAVELSIRGLAPLAPDSERTPAVVLPCGHMACEPCFLEMAATKQKPADHFFVPADPPAPCACPMCRAPTGAARCGHTLARGLPVGEENMDDVARAEEENMEDPVGFMVGLKFVEDTEDEEENRVEWCERCLEKGANLNWVPEEEPEEDEEEGVWEIIFHAMTGRRYGDATMGQRYDEHGNDLEDTGMEDSDDDEEEYEYDGPDSDDEEEDSTVYFTPVSW